MRELVAEHPETRRLKLGSQEFFKKNKYKWNPKICHLFELQSLKMSIITFLINDI